MADKIQEIQPFSKAVYLRSLLPMWSNIPSKSLSLNSFRDKQHFQFLPKFKMEKIWEMQHLSLALHVTSLVPKGSKMLGITLSVTVFKINDTFDFRQTLKWQPKFRKFNIFQRHCIKGLMYPKGPKYA